MRLWACAVLGLLFACSETRQASPFDPRPVRELQQWEARVGDRVVGRVVAIEIEDPEHPEVYYQVRNVEGQWLGYVDGQLRVYQRVPFSMTELFRGAHPMEEGLALLYEEDDPIRLVPLDEAGRVDSGAAEAAAERK